MSSHCNPRLGRLFLLITAIGAAHMGEQLLFGIEEFYMLRRQVERWRALFPPVLHDHANVILITLVFLFVSMLIYAAMRGGKATATAMLLFGILGVSEAHHWIEALTARAYDPGLVTSLPFALVGGLLAREALVGRKQAA